MSSPVVIISTGSAAASPPAGLNRCSLCEGTSSNATSESEDYYSYIDFAEREQERLSQREHEDSLTEEPPAAGSMHMYQAALLHSDYIAHATRGEDSEEEAEEKIEVAKRARAAGGSAKLRKRGKDLFLEVLHDLEDARTRECQRLEEQLALLQQARHKDAEVYTCDVVDFS